MTTQMIIRIDSKLKARLQTLAKAEGKPVSSVVRELIEEYVRDRDMASYIDDLWSRIGGKLKDRNVSTKEIQKVIKKVRAGK